jgi:ABC-type proline/glycine betaine transport system permease subunit
MKWKNPQQKVRVLTWIVFFLVYSIAYWIIPRNDARHFLFCWLATLVVGIPVAILLARKVNPELKIRDSNDKKVLFTGIFLLVLFLIPYVLCLFFA